MRNSRENLHCLFLVCAAAFALLGALNANAGTGYLEKDPLTGEVKWHFTVLFLQSAPGVPDPVVWRSVFNRTQTYLYQSTNGKFQFGDIKYAVRTCTEVSLEPCYDPTADVIIYADVNRASGDVSGTNRLGQHVFLTNSLLGTAMVPDIEYAAKIFMHELGHYLFSFYDEYCSPDDCPDPLTPLQCIHKNDGPLDIGACFMEYFLATDVDTKTWCHDGNHEFTPPKQQDAKTSQSFENKDSCWETMLRIYAPREFFGVAEALLPPNNFPMVPPNPSYQPEQKIHELVVAVDANIFSRTANPDMKTTLYQMLDRVFASNPTPNSFVTFWSYSGSGPSTPKKVEWKTVLIEPQAGTSIPQYRSNLDSALPPGAVTGTSIENLLMGASSLFSPNGDSRILLICTSGVESTVPVSNRALKFFRDRNIRTTVGFVTTTGISEAFGGVAESLGDAFTLYDATFESANAFQAVDAANKQLICVETQPIAAGSSRNFSFTLPGPVREMLVSVSWKSASDCIFNANFVSPTDSISQRIFLSTYKAQRYSNLSEGLPAGTHISVTAFVPAGCGPSPVPVTFSISDERPTIFLTATAERARFGKNDFQVIHGRVTVKSSPLINVGMLTSEVNNLGEFRDNPVALGDSGTTTNKVEGDWLKDDGIYSKSFSNQSQTGLRTFRFRATSLSNTKLAAGEKFSNSLPTTPIPGFRREAFTTFVVPVLSTTLLTQFVQIDSLKRFNKADTTVRVYGSFKLAPGYPYAFLITGQVVVTPSFKSGTMKIDGNTFTATVPASNQDKLQAFINIKYRTGDEERAQSLIVGMDEKANGNIELPKEFKLYQNYPNPFNSGTRFTFDLPTRGEITLDIYDMMGRNIRTLFAGKVFFSGKHEIEWDGRTDEGALAGSGVYFIRIKAGNAQRVQKILLLQ